MNKIFLSGNLTRDFEGGGNSKYNYARAGLAVKRPFAKNDEVDFFNLVAFNKTADFCTQYLSKGRKVFVEGRIQFEEYKDKDGNKRTGHSVIIDNIEFGDNKKAAAGNADENENDYEENVNVVDVPF